VFPESSKFWRASDSFFQSASATQTYTYRGVDISSDYVWKDWVQKSKKPDRRKRKMDIGTWQQSRAKTPFLKEFRGVDNRFSRLNTNREVAIAIRTDPAFRTNILDIAGSVGPIVAKEMDRALASIAFNAWRNWPIKTTLSKALLSLEYEALNAQNMQGSVKSNAWYTFYIRSRQKGLGGKQPHRVLIFEPSDQKMRVAGERIAQQIQQYTNGRSA
jgi:hypothetical protein